MKKQVFFIICFVQIVCISQAQVNHEELVGRWKFVKMEMPNSIGFDLDSLTASYKRYFEMQKHDVYHDVISTNDSLYIQVQFEKLVNDVNRMFIEFTNDKQYETNGYNKEGDMTEQSEKGTFFLNKSKNVIYTYRNGNKNQAGRFKIISLDKTKLVIVFDRSSRPAVFTCRKVS